MSKFQIPESLDVSSPEVIRSFIKDRKKHFNSSMAKAGVLPFSAQYARNMAHCLSESPSSLVALDSDDLEPPVIDTSRMTARFVITTSARDRHGDIVIPRGCVNHLKNYSRNPRVFFGHKTEELPIASARDPEGNLTLEIFDDKIYSTAYFHGETRESEIVFRLIARKELQASSIGFLPIRASIIMDDEGEDMVDLETGEEILDFRGNQSHSVPALRFLEWDMIEWSVVPIPANQEALAAHLSRGHVEGEKISPAIRKALSSYVPLSVKKSVSLAALESSYFKAPILPLTSDDTVKIIGVLPQGPTPGIEEVIKEETKESVDKEERDEVYAKYKKETNMSHKELKAWSENKCSKKASLSTGPIKRNLELLSTKKESWTKKHITWANKTIAFNSRMRKMPKGKPVSKECKISKRDISLKNWAYDPNKGSKKKSYISIFERLGNEKVKASVKEVKMAMAVLLSLQEGVDIPKKLKLGVYNQLAKVYKVLYLLPLEYRNISGLEEVKALFPDLDIKEFATVSIKEKNWFKSAMEDLVPPPAQGKPAKKKEKEDEKEDEDDKEKEIKASEDADEADDEEEKEIEEAAKAAEDDDEDEEKEEASEEEKAEASDEDESEEKAENEDPTHTAIKSMAEVLHSMHESCSAHTELLKGIHEKLDQCCNALSSKAEEEDKAEQEDEMKTLINSLMALKSNQDALNKRLFEVTGKR
jgi:hypothetical protein